MAVSMIRPGLTGRGEKDTLCIHSIVFINDWLYTVIQTVQNPFHMVGAQAGPGNSSGSGGD
jgi:hypothetical protein